MRREQVSFCMNEENVKLMEEFAPEHLLRGTARMDIKIKKERKNEKREE